MAKNVDMIIKGIKCDNPNCDFVDMDIPFEDYDNWLNKPCPKCGANLLTQKDYDACKIMMKISGFLNLLPTLPGRKFHQQWDFNGKGFDGIHTSKYYNIIVVKGDITQMKHDVIVNAANSTLMGGGGVDGAIHKAAGSKLLYECMHLGGCRIGEAKLTKGYKLPTPFIIHTVAPQYNKMSDKEMAKKLLRNCYQNSLQLATDNNLNDIAFPCIGTGIFHFPKEEAMNIAIDVVSKFLKTHKNMKVTFVCYLNEDYDLYKSALIN